jgi:hypothetical protein
LEIKKENELERKKGRGLERELVIERVGVSERVRERVRKKELERKRVKSW